MILPATTVKLFGKKEELSYFGATFSFINLTTDPETEFLAITDFNGEGTVYLYAKSSAVEYVYKSFYTVPDKPKTHEERPDTEEKE